MCHPERLRVVNAATLAGAASIYTTCCHTPASGETLESYCSHYHSCPYIAQFTDQEPALRILTHARISTRQPNDLRIPTADLTIVDKSAIEALATSAIVEPSLLSDPASYASEQLLDNSISEAAATGQVVADDDR